MLPDMSPTHRDDESSCSDGWLERVWLYEVRWRGTPQTSLCSTRKPRTPVGAYPGIQDHIARTNNKLAMRAIHLDQLPKMR